MSSDPSPLLETLNDRVLTLTLNRPERKNALNPEMNNALLAILKRAEQDPAVGAVLLTGAGTTFCVGGDVGSMNGGGTVDAAELLPKLQVGSEICLMLHRMAKPTIAMVRGAAAGGGLALAAACDLRICSDSAKFTYAYTKIGLAGDFAASFLMEKLLGTTRAREFCFFSPVVEAQEALRIGLVSRVVPDAELEAQAYALARQLANGPGFALAQVKANLNAAAELAPEAAVAREEKSFVECRQHPDHREAARAFIEKRAPVFQRGD
jgi:2-(1,2-epoxy-1,2-dihydrophenyl)acetyl-CoA isomerase